MKARRVKGLDPDTPLAANAARLVRVRADELHGFVPRALDPDEVEALHDMRIAAKRLRYVLELTAHCFGPYAGKAGKRAKELQDVLGDIHDCDVTLPRLRALAAEHDGDDARPGIDALSTAVADRRTLLFERFLEQWRRLEGEGFRTRLQDALAEPPSR